VRCLGAMRCLPVSVGRSALAAQDSEPAFLAVARSSLRLLGDDVRAAEADMSTVDGAGTAVFVALADTGAATESDEAGLGVAAEPLLRPLMINIGATTKTITVPSTSPRRAQ
jgi:hypothetical protein